MIPYINIHTHHLKNTEGSIFIQNFAQQEWDTSSFKELLNATNKTNRKISIGLHPWFLTKKNAAQDFEKLTQLIENKNITAIGECGLDRLKGENLDFQAEIFKQQLHLAESQQKPVIIHCVRAYNEIIQIKKKLEPNIPLIIHGFNKNETLLIDLLKNGFYISIGPALLRGRDDFRKSLLHIPLDRLFFETDDQDMTVHSLYQMYADTAKIDLDTLKSKIYNNFSDLLGEINSTLAL